MTDLSFEIPIRCEGIISDEHLPREQVQKFLNHLTDTILKKCNHRTEKLKLNLFRDGNTTIFRRLKL